MIAAPAIISARAAAFVRSSSVTPRAAAIHLGMNQIQSATKSAAKKAERRSANQRLDIAASFSHRLQHQGLLASCELYWRGLALSCGETPAAGYSPRPSAAPFPPRGPNTTKLPPSLLGFGPALPA